MALAALGEKVGLLDADIDAVMDYEWWLRIAQKYEPYFIDRYLAYFPTLRLATPIPGPHPA